MLVGRQLSPMVGGVLDTQVPGQTGVFFQTADAGCTQAALFDASEIAWDYGKIRNHALSQFSRSI